MATGPRYKVAFRRRREGVTDYYVRKKLLSGRETRAVVRRSSKYVSVQLADFTMNGDAVIAAASSKDLKEMGWTNSCSSIPAAYLTGYLAGKRALKAGIEYAVLDIGMQTPAKGAVLFAVVAGMVEAGLEVPHGDGVLPTDDRLYGEHINGSISKDVESAILAMGGVKKERKPAAAKTKVAKDAGKPADKSAAKKPAAKDKGADKTADKSAAKAPANKKVKEAE